jgi:hypothetical protein
VKCRRLSSSSTVRWIYVAGIGRMPQPQCVEFHGTRCFGRYRRDAHAVPAFCSRAPARGIYGHTLAGGPLAPSKAPSGGEFRSCSVTYQNRWRYCLRSSRATRPFRWANPKAAIAFLCSARIVLRSKFPRARRIAAEIQELDRSVGPRRCRCRLPYPVSRPREVWLLWR